MRKKWVAIQFNGSRAINLLGIESVCTQTGTNILQYESIFFCVMPPICNWSEPVAIILCKRNDTDVMVSIRSDIEHRAVWCRRGLLTIVDNYCCIITIWPLGQRPKNCGIKLYAAYDNSLKTSSNRTIHFRGKKSEKSFATQKSPQ